MPDLYLSKNQKKSQRESPSSSLGSPDSEKKGSVRGELFSSQAKKEEAVFQQEKVKTPAKDKKEKLVEQKAKEEETELKETTNPIAAFAPKPIGVRFETQTKEEEIVLLLRAHWITNIPWIFLGGILIIAPLVLRWLPFLGFLPTRYQLVGVIIWYLLTTIIIFERFLTWYFNAYIITDERVVDVDFHNLIYKEVFETKIDKIQDITIKHGGAIRTLFNFADIYIQTAGAEPNCEFLAVPKPERVVMILNEIREEEEREFLEGRVR